MLSTFVVLPFTNFSYRRYMSLAVDKMPVNGLEEPTVDEGLMYAIVCYQPGHCAEGSANEP